MKIIKGAEKLAIKILALRGRHSASRMTQKKYKSFIHEIITRKVGEKVG